VADLGTRKRKPSEKFIIGHTDMTYGHSFFGVGIQKRAKVGVSFLGLPSTFIKHPQVSSL
jgi:hypothetical protein